MEKDVNELNIAYQNALQGYDIAVSNILKIIDGENIQINEELKKYLKNEIKKARESFVNALFDEEKGEML